MDTKLKGDIGEEATCLAALKKDWAVFKPIGDRLPYNMIFDINGILVKVQVKSAWFDKKTGNYVIDNRRTKTNRRNMKRSPYKLGDFDFAVIYIQRKETFYSISIKNFH